MDDQEPLKPTDRIASPAKSRLTPESALPNPSGERSSTFSSPKPSQEQQKSSSIFGCALTSQSSSETYQSPLFHPSMLEAPSEKLKPQNSSSNSLQQSEKDEESATVPLGGCAFVSQLNVSKSSAITGNPNPINRMPVFGTPWTGIRHSAQSFDFKVPGTRMLSFDSPPTESPKIVPTRTEERTFPTGKPTFLEVRFSKIPI